MAKLWTPKPLWVLPPNPYVNHTPPAGTYEKVKWTVVGLTLFLPRLLGVILTVVIVWIMAKITVMGWPTGPKMRIDMPLPDNGWRRLIQRILFPAMVRINLFCLGFHWIDIKGCPAPRAEAPIVVCNHQGFPDIWWFIWQFLPVGVSAAENMRFPVMGDIMLSQQTIFVAREEKDSALKAADMMVKVAKDPRWPPIVVYPEGNTSNGRQLCAFKMGPFQPGLPVQPCVISYPNKFVDASWEEPMGLPVHIVAIRLLLQFHNYMQVHYLPVIVPTEAEKKDPALFAARVKQVMAAALGVTQTEYSFADTRLLFSARKLKVPMGECAIEMEKVTREWGVSYSDARDALERFAAGAGPRTKTLDADALVRALGLSAEEATDAFKAKLLSTFDQGSKGSVTFREFVAGLAPLAAEVGRAGTDPFVAKAVGVMRRKYL